MYLEQLIRSPLLLICSDVTELTRSVFIRLFFTDLSLFPKGGKEMQIMTERSDAVRAGGPSLRAPQSSLSREREGRACVPACVSAPSCVCVRVCGGETLFLDVTVQPSQPLLSNTSLLF